MCWVHKNIEVIINFKTNNCHPQKSGRSYIKVGHCVFRGNLKKTKTKTKSSQLKTQRLTMSVFCV